MPKHGPAVKNRRNNLYIFCVIALSVTTVAILAATFLSHSSSAAIMRAAGQRAVSSLKGNFSCTASVTADGKSYEVKLQKPCDGDYKMSFVKPADLNSLSFEKNAQGLKVKFGALEAAVDASTIPQTSIFNTVLGAFSQCSKEGISAKKQGNDVALFGSTPAGSFTLTLDSAMRPKTLSVPDLKLSAAFKDFSYS